MYKCRECKVEFAGGYVYEVSDGNGVRHIVHLGEMSCVCRQWELSGIPCIHALAAICYSRQPVEEFVHPYFTKEAYLRAHTNMIHPILDHTMWNLVPGEPLQPSPLRRKRGRPRISRRRGADEPTAGQGESKRSHTLRCKKCKEVGHNSRTCQGGAVKDRGKGSGSASVKGKEIASVRGKGSGPTSVKGKGIESVRGKGSGSVKGTCTTSVRGKGSGTTEVRTKGSGSVRGKGRGTGTVRGRGTGTIPLSGRGTGTIPVSGRGNGRTRGTKAASVRGRGSNRQPHVRFFPFFSFYALMTFAYLAFVISFFKCVNSLYL